MDALQRMFKQFSELYRSMAPSQRMTLIAVPALILLGFGWLLMQQRGGNETALSWGKVFTSEELMSAEQALITAGLHDFHREGQRIMVPVLEADAYNQAIASSGVAPRDMGAELLKHYDSLGPFSTEKERNERREAMLLQEVRRVIRTIPEIEDAHVAIASSGMKTWSQRPKVTANVTVHARGGHELSSKLVRSLRTAVASMVPDLQPANVTVLDASNGVTHTADSADDPLNDQLVHRIDQFQMQYERQISQALSYIPNIGVTVNVDVENLKSSVVRNQVVDPKKFAPVFAQESNVKDSQQQQPAKGEAGQAANRPAAIAANPGVDRNRQFSDASTQSVNGVSFEVSEKQLIAAMPKAVQVSVTIPRDYYRSVATQREAAGEKEPTKLDPTQIEQDVLAAVKATVTNLIPADSPTTAVTVNSIDRVVVEAPVHTVPFTDNLWDWLRQWGGALVLTGLALFALMSLRKSTGSLPETATPEINSQSLAATQERTESAVPRPPTKRDTIQTLVRDNPEATAQIISKWLSAAQ
ncbi:hypothetical protein GC163_06340 [bacterium]|nr:hypothetical protein [bacterium]